MEGNIIATMTLKETQVGTMKAELEGILLAISWADLSKTYFRKSNSWLYHKLDGIDGNKKPTEFSEKEKYILKGALVGYSSIRLGVTPSLFIPLNMGR